MRVEEIPMLVADVVLPPPNITVSKWADENLRENQPVTVTIAWAR